MSRRTDKKRLKKINLVHAAAPAEKAVAETPAVETPAETPAAEESVTTPAVQAPVVEETVAEKAVETPAENASTISIVVETPAAEEAVETPAAEEAAPAAPAYGMYIQYKNAEYNADVIAERVLEKCASENMDTTDLRIYVKPEDKKAYYACAGGNSYVTL